MRMTSLGPESQGQDEGSTCLVWGHIYPPSGPRRAPAERGWSQHHHQTTQTWSKESCLLLPRQDPSTPTPTPCSRSLSGYRRTPGYGLSQARPSPRQVGNTTPGLWWIRSHRTPGPVWSDPWGWASQGPHLALALGEGTSSSSQVGLKTGPGPGRGWGVRLQRDGPARAPLGGRGRGLTVSFVPLAKAATLSCPTPSVLYPY